MLHFILPELALVLLICLSPSLSHPVRVAASLAIIASCVYIELSYTTGTVGTDYVVGVGLFGTTILNVGYLGILTDPMANFRYLRDKNPAPLAIRPLYERALNAVCIIRNSRLIGWNVQVANVPARHEGSRTRYLLRRARQILGVYLMMDLCETFCMQNRYLYPYPPGALNAGSPGPEAWTYLARTYATYGSVTWLYSFLNLPYLITAFVVCATGIGQPEDWPDLFGNPFESYTVRRLWAHTWHHTFRRHFAGWAKTVAQALNLQRGSFISGQVQLHVGFFVSALLHSFGDLMATPGQFGRSMPFFMVTALAISFEDAVIALFKPKTPTKAADTNKGPSLALRALGTLWVAIWCRHAMPLYTDWIFESGVGDSVVPVLPFSPTKALFFSSVS